MRDFFVGEYGLITMGLTYAMAIVLPVVTTFFLMFGFLEDSGYIPRLAIFSDRLFRAMGLNGKAVLPMVLGLGCDTMATMTTRILGTPKERLIAITLLALGVPCSAQLATIMGILGGISVSGALTLFGVVLRRWYWSGFLPPARFLAIDRISSSNCRRFDLPRMRNLLTKTALRVRWYLGEAVPLFLAGTALLFVLDRLGALDLLSSAARPVVTGALGLPSESAGVFVMGFLRRDYGAAGLFKMAHERQPHRRAVGRRADRDDAVRAVRREPADDHSRAGPRTGLAILAAVTVIAIGTGTVLNAALTMLHITF